MKAATKHKKVIWLVIIFTVIVCVGSAWLYYRPIVSIKVTHSLIGPEDAAFTMLAGDDVTLEEFKAAVLASGKHVDDISWRGSSLLSRTVVKRWYDLSAWLLEQGANPDGIHPGTNPLDFAILNRDFEHIKLLLDYGANPSLETGTGTPRSTAVNAGYHDIVKILDEAIEKSKGADTQTQPAQ